MAAASSGQGLIRAQLALALFSGIGSPEQVAARGAGGEACETLLQTARGFRVTQGRLDQGAVVPPAGRHGRASRQGAALTATWRLLQQQIEVQELAHTLLIRKRAVLGA